MSLKDMLLKLYTKLLRVRYNCLFIGQRSFVYPNVQLLLRRGGEIRIGCNSKIGCFSHGYLVGFHTPCRMACSEKGTINIGNNCRINGANISAKSSITIGHGSKIACGVQILDYNAHDVYSKNRAATSLNDAKPIEIGNNVWIGLGAIILKGTIIGDNSVVAAGSIVKGVFPPYSIIMGNPAKVVKRLDPEKFKN